MKILLSLLLLVGTAYAQIPTPPVPTPGPLGPGGNFAFRNGGTVVFTSDADHNMTFNESTAEFFVVNAMVSLTTMRNIIAPAIADACYTGENLSTGAQSVRIIASTGTGVTIPYGSTVEACFDGTNYVPVGPLNTAPQISNVLQSANQCATQGTVYSPSANSGAGGCVAPLLELPTASQTVTNGNYSLTFQNNVTGPGSGIISNYSAHYNGWNEGQGVVAVNHAQFANCVFSMQGIKQCESAYDLDFGSGDWADRYHYSICYGNAEDAAAEGCDADTDQIHQPGVMSATAAGTPATGATTITVGTINCTLAGSGNGCIAPIGYFPNRFPQGGLLLDTTQVGSTYTLASFNAAGTTTLNGMSYTLSSGSPTVSSAYGNITNCTAAGDGTSSQPATCQITVTSGSGFTVGHPIYYAGYSRDASTITTVTGTVPSQTITFNSINTLSELNSIKPAVFQDGPGGYSFIGTGSLTTWPIAYQVLGYDGTNYFFSNPTHGSANGSSGGGNIIGFAPTLTAGNGANTANRNGTGTVTLSSSPGNNNIGPLNTWPVGSTVCLASWVPSDLNGCYTVLTNTMNLYGDNLTFAQAGAAESSSYPGSVYSPSPTITTYPSALITGSNNAVGSVVTIGSNTMTVANGDTLIGAPASEVEMSGKGVYIGQNTAPPGDSSSRAFFAFNHGPQPLTYMYTAISQSTGAAQAMFYVQGQYLKDFSIQSRPQYNGFVTFVAPNGGTGRYHIFGENATGAFDFDPVSSSYLLPNLSITGLSNGQCVQTSAGGASSGNLSTVATACSVAASLTTTSATSDTVPVAGMTSSGHCQFSATNASAATNYTTTYVSAKTTGQITLSHAATAGMTFDISCSAN